MDILGQHICESLPLDHAQTGEGSLFDQGQRKKGIESERKMANSGELRRELSFDHCNPQLKGLCCLIQKGEFSIAHTGACSETTPKSFSFKSKKKWKEQKGLS